MLSFYDYVGIALGFIVFIFFFMFAVVVRKKILLFIFVMFLALLTPFLTPFAIKYVMNEYVKKSKLEITLNKRLKFVDAIMIEGNITNVGIMPYKKCQVEAKYWVKGSNIITEYANRFKPYKIEKRIFSKFLDTNESFEFEILVENFKLKDGYSYLYSAECW